MSISRAAERIVKTENNAYINKLFAIFGVSDNTLSYPTIFHEKYLDEWKSFVGKTKVVSKRAALTTILDFLRYMEYHRITPFNTSVMDPLTKKKFKSKDAIQNIIFYDLEQIIKVVKESLRKLSFTRSFSIKKSKDWVTRSGSNFIINSVMLLTPKRQAESIDSSLSKLQGLLYTGEVPAQLQDRVSIQYGKQVSILKDSSYFFLRAPDDNSRLGWFFLEKSKNFTIKCQRVKKGIIFIVSIQFNPGVSVSDSAAIKLITSIWKSLK